MNLYLQDPTIPGSYSLHEALLHACAGSQYGNGAYSFVSQDGIKLLIEDDEFIKFIKKGEFNLVVGIDAITNEIALKRLFELKTVHTNLKVHAFLHDTKGSLFHPKISWFKKSKGGVFVVGSGNLTARGLRRNREAFSVVNVDDANIKKIEREWKEWLHGNAQYLRPIDDPEVLKRARLNVRVSKVINRLKKEIEPEVVVEAQEAAQQIELTVEDLAAWNFQEDDPVLIAEIPKSGNRWKQVNFDKETFIDFFGAQPGNNSHRIIMRSILTNGLLADIEIRPSISVKSQNYRFELNAAAGLDYPTKGRPIGIYVRVSVRMFLYMLIMPTDMHYKEVREYLDARWAGRTDRMKKYITKIRELRMVCKELPIWKLNLLPS